MNARFKGCHRNFLYTPDSVGKLFLYPIVRLFITWIGDFRKLRCPSAASKDPLSTVYVDCTLASMNPGLWVPVDSPVVSLALIWTWAPSVSS